MLRFPLREQQDLQHASSLLQALPWPSCHSRFLQAPCDRLYAAISATGMVCSLDGANQAVRSHS